MTDPIAAAMIAMEMNGRTANQATETTTTEMKVAMINDAIPVPMPTMSPTKGITLARELHLLFHLGRNPLRLRSCQRQRLVALHLSDDFRGELERYQLHIVGYHGEVVPHHRRRILMSFAKLEAG